MVEVVIPAGMKPWAGGDSAPADWDGGPVFLRCGAIARTVYRWRFGYPEDPRGLPTQTDVIAYTPRADVADSQQHANTVADSGVGVRCQQSERERVARIIQREQFRPTCFGAALDDICKLPPRPHHYAAADIAAAIRAQGGGR